MSVDTRPYSTVEVAELTGATYRQLDHWCRRGFIPGQPTMGIGSGHRRLWTDKQVEEVELLMRASRLINATLDEAVDLLRAGKLCE